MLEALRGFDRVEKTVAVVAVGLGRVGFGRLCGFGVWVLRVTGGMVLGRRSRRHLRMDYLILRSRVSLLGREELRSGRRSVCCFGVVGLVRSRDMAQVL